MISWREFSGNLAGLADGDAAYIVWSLGTLSLLAWAAGLRHNARGTRWVSLLQTIALLALPVLLLVGMVTSMIPPAR